MKNLKELVTIDPEVLSGQPVFVRTRVPVVSMFYHLERGVSLDEFLSDFPSVEKEVAVSVLEIAENLFSSGNINKLYETAA